MEEHDSRVEWLRRLQIERFGNRQVDLAERIGKSAAQVNQWMTGFRKIREDSARHIERKLGLPKGAMDADPNLDPAIDFTASGGAMNYPAPAAEALHLQRAVADQVAVPMLEVRASAGPGDIRPDDDPIVGAMRLNTSWVRRHLPTITSIQNLVTVIAHGHSMTPTFADGSILICDQGVRQVNSDGIYVLSWGDQLYVKRVTRRLPDGALMCTSDSPLHGGFTLENGDREKVEILGRVVWAFDSKGV